MGFFLRILYIFFSWNDKSIILAYFHFFNSSSVPLSPLISHDIYVFQSFVYFYKSGSIVSERPRVIGSPCSRSSNREAALAPPATSLAWRNTEQEFRLCVNDSVADGVTPTMTILWQYRSAPWSQLTSCGATWRRFLRGHTAAGPPAGVRPDRRRMKPSCSPWCSELDRCLFPPHFELLSGVN